MSAARPNRYPGSTTTCLSCRMGRHEDPDHGEHCRCPDLAHAGRSPEGCRLSGR